MNDKIIETCARAAHEVIHLYNDSIGDPRSPAWDDMTPVQRDGVRAGARHALNGGTPEASHDLWCATRELEGWTLGPVKSFEKKTSPCLVPYCELPEVQRRKDELFQSIVHAVAEALSP